MLEKFRTIKLAEIGRLEDLARHGDFPEAWRGKRPSFAASLAPAGDLPAVIAEYKRASPSRGIICETVDCSQAAREYLQNGAAALSILTESECFRGKLEYLAEIRKACGSQNPAMLRKDFIFHPLQIAESAASPASALLLIARMINDVRQLRDLREEAASQGLESVVEIFDERDLAMARDSGAAIIQVNSRDLATLRVDDGACCRLIEKAKPRSHEKWIAASGITRGSQLRSARDAGFDAVLIGSFLMAKGSPGASLRQLLEEAAGAL